MDKTTADLKQMLETKLKAAKNAFKKFQDVLATDPEGAFVMFGDDATLAAAEINVYSRLLNRELPSVEEVQTWLQRQVNSNAAFSGSIPGMPGVMARQCLRVYSQLLDTIYMRFGCVPNMK